MYWVKKKKKSKKVESDIEFCLKKNGNGTYDVILNEKENISIIKKEVSIDDGIKIISDIFNEYNINKQEIKNSS